MSRDALLAAQAEALGHRFDGEIRTGGNYTPVVRDGTLLYVSGQVPRVGTEVVVTGAVGGEVSLAQAQVGARICVLRALTLVQRALGTLDAVQAVPRMTVYVRCTPEFTQHSEVADAASAILHTVFGSAGAHARSAVGVLQLPKGAAVELELTVSAR